jgi:hypothetical protein
MTKQAGGDPTVHKGLSVGSLAGVLDMIAS